VNAYFPEEPVICKGSGGVHFLLQLIFSWLSHFESPLRAPEVVPLSCLQSRLEGTSINLLVPQNYEETCFAAKLVLKLLQGAGLVLV
jgi:hypothetical protein